MARESGFAPTVEIALQEYTELKRKEFVFDFEKAKIEAKVEKGSYVDDDTRMLYGVPTKDEMNAETLADLREKLNKEKAVYKWDEVTE